MFLVIFVFHIRDIFHFLICLVRVTVEPSAVQPWGPDAGPLGPRLLIYLWVFRYFHFLFFDTTWLHCCRPSAHVGTLNLFWRPGSSSSYLGAPFCFFGHHLWITFWVLKPRDSSLDVLVWCLLVCVRTFWIVAYMRLAWHQTKNGVSNNSIKTCYNKRGIY